MVGHEDLLQAGWLIFHCYLPFDASSTDHFVHLLSLKDVCRKSILSRTSNSPSLAFGKVGWASKYHRGGGRVRQTLALVPTATSIPFHGSRQELQRDLASAGTSSRRSATERRYHISHEDLSALRKEASSANEKSLQCCCGSKHLCQAATTAPFTSRIIRRLGSRVGSHVLEEALFPISTSICFHSEDFL